MKTRHYYAKYTMTASDGLPMEGTLSKSRITPLTPKLVEHWVLKTFGPEAAPVAVHSIEEHVLTGSGMQTHYEPINP